MQVAGAAGRVLCVLVFALSVSACGGGGGGGDDGSGSGPPMATDAGLITDEDTPLMLQLASDRSSGVTYAAATQPAHGTLTCSAAGACTYSPALNFNGDDQFTFTASASTETGAAATVTIEVKPINDPPTISGTPATTAIEDDEYTAMFTSADVEPTDAPTFSVVSGPAWLTINASTGELSGTPTNSDVGASGPIVVKVSDPDGASALAPPFTITVANTNDGPSISGNPPSSVDEDTLYTTTFTATDVDVGDTLTFSMTGAPAWLTIDSSTGVVSGTPTNADVGSSTIRVDVTDAAGIPSGGYQFDLEVVNVNDAPTISPPPTLAATEDSPYAQTVPALDVDVGDTLTYTLVSGPAWLSLDSSSGLLSGTPDNGDVGSGSVVVSVTDDVGLGAMTSFSITVANTNDAPVASAIPDQELDAYAPLTLDLSAYLIDVDAGDTLTYSVTANSSTSTVTTSLVGAQLTLRYRAASSATVSITVKLRDAAGASDSQTFTVLLSNARYAAHAGWNEYLLADGIDALSASDLDCTAPAGAGYGACIHGGQIRAVPTGLAVPCSGLSATDSLGVFQWTCRNQAVTGIAVFVSTGLVPGKGLTDLVDSSTLAWRPQQLAVTGAATFTSVAAEWWTTPIVAVPAPSGPVVTLSTPRTIHVMQSNPDREVRLEADGAALLIPPGVAATSSARVTSNVVSIGNAHSFLWIEGEIDNSNGGTGLHVERTMFSVVRGVHVVGNPDTGVSNSDITVYFTQNSLFADVVTAGGRSGLELNLDADDNTIVRYVGMNHNYGMLVYAERDHFAGVVLANCGVGVELATPSRDNVVSGVTATNSAWGVDGFGQNNLVIDLATANAFVAGIRVVEGSLSVLDVAATDAPEGIELLGGTLGIAGVLKVGATQGCYVEAESTSTGLLDDAAGSDGVHAGSCIAESPSTFTVVRAGVSAATAFVGKVSTDAANQSASGGTAAFPASPGAFDWFRFDSPYRTWGLDGGGFPDSAATQQWSTGTGRIWDWRLAAGDTGDAGQPAFLGASPLPATGNDIYTHTFSDTTTATFLRNAVELVGDGVGDDDLLCESNERCLVMPNLGAYQGHGALVSAPFAAGTLTGITLVRYATNGN